MPAKAIDITGQTFNRLTAIERVGSDKKGGALWLCQCTCGNKVKVNSYALRHGRVKSCGCLSKARDLTGQTFSRLTAIKRVGTMKRNGSPLWLCKCACGNITNVDSYALRHGTTKSCGCLANAIDLTDQTFGRLIVIKRNGSKQQNGNALWLCKCVCGNTITTDSYSLRHGVTKSCGCLAKEIRAMNIRKNPKTRASMGHASNLGIVDHHNEYPSRVKSKRNKSGVIGVSWNTHEQRWVATFYYKGHYMLHKLFTHFDDAVAARKACEDKYLSKFEEPSKVVK